MSIAASQPYAAFLLPPILHKLCASHPEIEIKLVAKDTPSDLLRRESDIAIRNFQPTEPDLVAHRELRNTPRIRRVFDHLAMGFGARSQVIKAK